MVVQIRFSGRSRPFHPQRSHCPLTRVSVCAQLAHECPAINALNLYLCFLGRLIRMRSCEGAYLKEQRSTQADADTGTATQTSANWNGGSKSVYESRTSGEPELRTSNRTLAEGR